MKKKKILLGLGLLSLSAFTLASCASINGSDSSVSINTPSESTSVVSKSVLPNQTTTVDSVTTTTENVVSPTTTSDVIPTTSTGDTSTSQSNNVDPTATTGTNTPTTTSTTTNVVPTTTSTTTNVVPTTSSTSTTTSTTTQTTTQVVNNKVTVSFVFNINGASLDSLTIDKNTSINTPTAPTVTGYRFIGWYTDSSCNTSYNFNSSISDDVEIYGKYVQQFTVTFMVDGTKKSDEKIDSNGKVTKPSTDPSKSGYTFNYWEKDGVEYNFNIPVTSNIILTAHFTPVDGLTTIGFGSGLTSWSDLEAAAGTKVSDGKTVFAGAVTMNNITFPSNGKNRVDNGATYNVQQTEISINMKTAGTIYVEGTWGSDSAGGYVHLKNSNGTEVYKSSQYPAKPKGSAGADISFSQEVPAGVYLLTADKTVALSKLYYSRVIETVTVTYVMNGGNAIPPVTLEKNDKLSSLPEPVYEGHIFQGWYSNSGLTTEFNIDNAIATDTNIYAKWKVYDVNDYATIKYNTGISNQTITDTVLEKGKTLPSLPQLPEVTNYRFDGWYNESNFQTRFDISLPINASATIYARYVRQYNVTFKDKDGGTLQVVTTDEGLPVNTIPTNTFVSGYNFKYWSLTENGSEFDLGSEDINSNITLYPVYEAANDSKINIMSYSGDQESLYCEFIPIKDVENYNIYVRLSTDSIYTKIDQELLRVYQETGYKYYRFDAVGLKAGKYSFKIVPVISNVESTANQEIIDNVNVISYDRTGFAFSTASPLAGKTVGAYNLDGTLKSDAIVIYVTESNKTTVTATIVKSNKGATETATGIGNITALYSKGYESRPIDIRIIGKVTQSGLTNANDDINLSFKEAYKNVSNIADAGITIEGIGNDATLYGVGVRLLKCKNAEIRNLGLMDWPDDGIALETSNINMWVHDNDIFYGHKGSDKDQIKGDGSMDLKNDSQYITISYMHFWDSGKMSLCGMKSETGPNYISYHHNWFDHSDSRHPRVRTMSVHVYNNYFDGNSKYGVGATYGADIFVEGNYFRNCKDPMLSSKCGTDALGDGTFSGEAGGVIKAYNNYIEGSTSLIYANADKGVQGATTNANATSFDAYLASTRNETVPSTYKATTGDTYSNFDTQVDLGVTAAQIQSPEDARVTTMSYAGRVQGGDFKWTFDNSVDDTSYALNEPLMDAIVAYSNKLVKVFGID